MPLGPIPPIPVQPPAPSNPKPVLTSPSGYRTNHSTFFNPASASEKREEKEKYIEIEDQEQMNELITGESTSPGSASTIKRVLLIGFILYVVYKIFKNI